jgi:hypothetical protein
MSSVFSGVTGLRSRYAEAATADLAGKTSKTTALYIAEMDMGARFLYIDNGLDAVLDFWLVHPGAVDPADPANRLFFLEIGKNRVMNFDFLPSLGMFFDPGSRLYVAVNGSAPTNGDKLRISWWA